MLTTMHDGARQRQPNVKTIIESMIYFLNFAIYEKEMKSNFKFLS
jgi:hypothetical protein